MEPIVTSTQVVSKDVSDEASMNLNEQDLEVVQRVLTLPGIAGFAFLDRSKSPQIYNWMDELAFHQSDVFVTSAVQVLESMPSEFYQLEFGFGTYRVLLRRLVTGDGIALVMNATLDWSREQTILAEFCRVILSARAMVFSEIQAHQQRMQALRSRPPTVLMPRDGKASSGSGTVQPVIQPVIQPAIQPAIQPMVSRTLLLGTFNRLIAIAGRYVGPSIMMRHLTLTRPLLRSLDTVTIGPRGTLEMTGPDWLEAEQVVAFDRWIQAFIQQCSKIIRNFDTMVRQEGLTEEEIAVLFPNP